MKNSFGNYVVQKALTIAEGEVKEDLAMAIQENLQHLTEKKLRSKWTQILDKSAGMFAPQSEVSKSQTSP